MKTIKNWLLSAAAVMLMSVSFGQAQSTEVCNNTIEDIKVVLAAVDAPNTGPVQRTAAQTITPGNCAVFTPIFQSQNAEWIYVMAGISPWNSVPPYNDAIDENVFATSTQLWIQSTEPTVGTPNIWGYTISWFAAFQIDIN